MHEVYAYLFVSVLFETIKQFPCRETKHTKKKLEKSQRFSRSWEQTRIIIWYYDIFIGFLFVCLSLSECKQAEAIRD